MRVIVTSQRGVHVDVIQKGLEDGSFLGRAVEIMDSMPESDRNLLARIEVNEFDKLYARPEVLSIEHQDMPTFGKFATQAITPIFQNGQNATHDNWGLDYCTEQDGVQYRYSHEGEGVDVVISDSGITLGHTEFNDDQASSRVQTIEWQANQSTNYPGHYTDTFGGGGHGTHVAGTVAGLTQGWARKADIYAIHLGLYDSGVGGTDPDGYDILVAMQLVRNWHNTKGTGRPTVLNCSWGSSFSYPTNYPDGGLAGTTHAYASPSLVAEIESMVADGIVVVAAAGNDGIYIADNTDPLYNERYKVIWNGTTMQYDWVADTYTGPEVWYWVYPFRATHGTTVGSICVGALGDRFTLNKAMLSDYTNRGTAVDVFAPGSGIQSALNDVSSAGLLTKLDGTSMASPQVAGMAAVYLGWNPTATPAEVRNYITRYGQPGTVQDNLAQNGAKDGATDLVARSVYNGLQVKDAGEWKTVKDPQAKDAGTWQPVKEAFKKVSGQWVKIFG